MKREEYEALRPRVDKYRALQEQLAAVQDVLKSVEEGYIILCPDGNVCRGDVKEGFLRVLECLQVEPTTVKTFRSVVRQPLLERMNDLETEMEET
jgi:hypothetical protein